MITKDMLIVDIIKSNLMFLLVLNKYGMQCCNCSGRYEETLEYGAQLHHVDIDALVNELNKLNN